MFAGARFKGEDVLASVSWPYGVFIFFCCNSRYARGPLQRIGIVIPPFSSTTLSPGQKACRKVSQASATKIIGAARKLHTKTFTLTI